MLYNKLGWFKVQYVVIDRSRNYSFGKFLKFAIRGFTSVVAVENKKLNHPNLKVNPAHAS